MQVISILKGKLRVDVASRGTHIPKGTIVRIEQVADNSRNLKLKIVSKNKEVMLPFFGTDIDEIV